MSPSLSSLARLIRKDPVTWAASCGITLRPYQRQIALAIKDSIVHHRGLTFVVILPRQSGKNEVQRHLFGWLLYRAAERGGTMVSVAPTFKPQTVNSMDRLRLTLDRNPATRGLWRSSAGFIFRFRQARIQFFSGEPKARVVGATADLLLSVDEAQDIDPVKFDKEFDPMTASTNATRVFWGTAWTSQTLLSRQSRIAREEQARDGLQRLFFYTGDDVARLVPEYGAHLERVVRERGRQHPLVRTQYFNEEIDAVAGMFTPARMALMESAQLSAFGSQPEEGRIYAFCIDVAGMDEDAASLGSRSSMDDQQSIPLERPLRFPSGVLRKGLHCVPAIGNSRDSTTLSIVEVDLSTLETLHAPTYRVVQREAWTGLNHLTVFGRLKALAEAWSPRHIVIDATGVGEGLWALLDRALPGRVIPVKFTQREKSEIGWRFLSIIETGRFKAFSPSSVPEQSTTMPIRNQQSTIINPELVRLQYLLCQSEVLPGPARTLRWGVPDGTRGPDGQLVHDDFVLADSLVAKLDELRWAVRFDPFIIQPRDPLEELSRTRAPEEF